MLLHKTAAPRVFLFFLAVLLSVSACSKTEQKTNTDREAQTVIEEKEKPGLLWYRFAETPAGGGNGKIEIVQTESPFAAKAERFLPWTEAVRISGIAVMYDPPLLLINKTGVMAGFGFEEAPETETVPLFAEKTADGFYKTDSGNLIRFYNNSIFSAVTDTEEKPCLCRYNLASKEFTPLIFPHHFGLKKKAQLAGLEFEDRWFASFKTEKNEQVEFDYFSFSGIESLLNGRYTKIDQEEFIARTAPVDVRSTRAKAADLAEFTDILLNEKTENIQAEVFSDNLKSRILLIKTDGSEEAEIRENKNTAACAAEFGEKNGGGISKAILFNSGKLFFKKNGNWDSLSLPELPHNFSYTYFIVKNGAVTAGWEEQRFFEVGQAGFLVYKLPDF